MVGLGETKEEIIETMDDLRAANVDIMTIGQYLQPSKKHLKVQKYYHPDEFAELRKLRLKKASAIVKQARLSVLLIMQMNRLTLLRKQSRKWEKQKLRMPD